jgi:uncharacterized membrane protein YgcG
MVVVTALIRVAFLIDVGLLYSSVFLVGLVVVIVVMVGLVVVGVINYWWWLWQSSGCGGGDFLCKGCSYNSCKRALGMCTMCCKVYDEGGCGGGGGGCGGGDGGGVYVGGGGGGEYKKNL